MLFEWKVREAERWQCHRCIVINVMVSLAVPSQVKAATLPILELKVCSQFWKFRSAVHYVVNILCLPPSLRPSLPPSLSQCFPLVLQLHPQSAAQPRC